MRIGKAIMVLATVFLSMNIAPGMAVSAGPARMGRMASENGGGNINVDLAVRQVTVTPVRAYVGDKVRVEVLVENKAEGKDTTNADIYANGKMVGRQLFTWGLSPGERLYRLSFEWDTRGFPPGEYKIRAEAYIRVDSSPFDNDLTVQQPVVLAPPGGAFPGGEAAGGTVTETDPRFGKDRLGG
jgi:hypothetical protein